MTVKPPTRIQRATKIQIETTAKDDISDLEWFATHSTELDKYRDNYVAIVQKKVVAVAPKLKEVIEESKRKIKDSQPLIVRIGRNYDSVL